MKLFFLIIICFVGILRAQMLSVRGILKDSDNGHPLPYASIQVLNTNIGVISSEDGRFSLSVDLSACQLFISLIGYESRTILIENSENDLELSLIPKSYETGLVRVPPLTWAEKFITNVIKVNDEQNGKLNFYKADAYAKTSFSKYPDQLIGLIESVSEVSYLKPDKFQEKLLSTQIPPHIKNLPYSSISINQQININSDFIKLQNIYFISPLSHSALNYYDFSFMGRKVIQNDTLVIISVIPKLNSVPLFQGRLNFKETDHKLLELDLKGNEQAKTAVLDSIRLFQRYSLQDSIFNLPFFSQCSIQMNCVGMNISFQQEYSFINYRINDNNSRPLISGNNQLIEDIQPDINIDSRRNNVFKMPLTRMEQKHINFVDSVFVKAPFLKRLFFLTLFQCPPLLLDETINFGNFNILHFSNWYHFNKVDGNYLGFEFLGYNNEHSSMFFNAGYGFASGIFALNLIFTWIHFDLKLSRSTSNLGSFPYNKSMHTFDALIYHEDDFNYYLSHKLLLSYDVPLTSTIFFTPYLLIEEQKPVETTNEFSLFNRGKNYASNFKIREYSNNKAGLKIAYIQQPEEESISNPSSVKGRSFLNFSSQIEWASKQLIKSTENNYNFNLDLHRHQELLGFEFDLFFYLHKQSETTFIQNLSFVSSNQNEQYHNSGLSFFSLQNYQYFLQDYFRINTEAGLVKLPALYNFRITIGCIYSFLNPLNTPQLSGFTPLQTGFHEFGLSVKGISFINFYIIKNSSSNNNIYLKLKIGL